MFVSKTGELGYIQYAMKGKRLAEGGFINLQSQENGVLFPCSTFPCSPQGKIPIDKVTTVCQEKITYLADQVTEMINSPSSKACSSSGLPDLLFSSTPVSPLSIISYLPRVVDPNRLPFGRLDYGKKLRTSPVWQEIIQKNQPASTYVLCAISRNVCWLTRCDVGQVISIDILPDEILLAIFDFYMEKGWKTKREIEKWQSLVHVCRRWRNIVFGSPCRLNLRLVGTPDTPVRDTLEVWPPLPLLVEDYDFPDDRTEGLDNTIAILEHMDRVCQIELTVDASSFEVVSSAMQAPFPELSHLRLNSYDEVSALPDSFLGGSVPRLRYLSMMGIPFPGLPKLLLSATHLVELHLCGILHSDYISPETMVVILSTLTSLESFQLVFQFPGSLLHPASRRPPPLTRLVIPALTLFIFDGANEYFDDLVAHIDAPRLDDLFICFFHQIGIDPLQATQFINRTPKLKALEKAQVIFRDGLASVNLSSGSKILRVAIPCEKLDQQISSLKQVCTSSLHPLSTCEDLHIFESLYREPEWQDIIESTLWLELLRPFTAVKNLYLSENITQCIVPALQELVGSRTIEVLPTLENIFLKKLQLSGSVQEGMMRFVDARQVTSHPVAVSRLQADDSDSDD